MSSKIKILNASLEELATLSTVITANRLEKINTDNVLNFQFRIKNAASAYINDTNVIGLDDDYFDIAAYKKAQQGDGSLVVDVECEHVSYRLNNSDYDVEYFTQTGTPTEILTAILNGTDFTVGTVSFAESETFSIQEATSRRGVLMQFVAYLGGEVEFDGFSVSILTQRGSATPTALTTGKDVTVMSKYVNKRVLDSLGNPTISYMCGVYDVTTLALGDVVTLDYDSLDIDVSLRVVSISYDPYNPKNSTVIEVGNYVNGLEDEIYRITTEAVRKDETMNGCRIGPEYGFEAVRNDNKARAYLKSDGMAFQSGDGSGASWTNRMYYDSTNNTWIFNGTLSASILNAIIALVTPSLTAEKATIAELTVDQLDTSTKVQNYLSSSTDDVNYIKVYEQHIQFITASTDGLSTEQAENRNSEPLYWTDDTHTATTTDVTAYPVTVYVYTEYVKLDFSFEDFGTNYAPLITLGVGNGVDDEKKGFIWKGDEGLYFKYVNDDGDDLILELSEDGIKLTGGTGETGLRNIHVSATEPATSQTNDLWIDTTNAALKYYNGSAYVEIGGEGGGSGGGVTITANTDAAPALGTLANSNLYRCTNTSLTTAPTMTIAAIASTSTEFSCAVTFKAPNSTKPVVTNNSGYTIKYSGKDVSNGTWTPVSGTVYRLGWEFDGINLNAYVSGVK